MLSLTDAEKAFARSFNQAGYGISDPASWSDVTVAHIGNYICSEIRPGQRPGDTQAFLSSRYGLSAYDSGEIYSMAHEKLCASDSIPNMNEFGDGVYEVGVDIMPGKYRSLGGDSCYWARLAKDDQSRIIDNYLGSGPNILTIKASDGYIELRRCTWTKSD